MFISGEAAGSGELSVEGDGVAVGISMPGMFSCCSGLACGEGDGAGVGDAAVAGMFIPGILPMLSCLGFAGCGFLLCGVGFGFGFGLGFGFDMPGMFPMSCPSCCAQAVLPVETRSAITASTHSQARILALKVLEQFIDFPL
ncbi:MAG TPA: hypothetical protein VF544_18055 [Pyrinomonadaceae bacterium]|jgi:hypothetical protein